VAETAVFSVFKKRRTRATWSCWAARAF